MTLGTQNRLKELFQKYVNRNITKEEYAELFMYIRNPEVKQDLLDFMDEHNKEVQTNISVHEIDWDTMYSNIIGVDVKKHRTIPLWKLSSVAAALLVFFIGGYLLLPKAVKLQEKVELKYKNDVSPGGDKALLTLADGNVVNLTDSLATNLDIGKGVSIKRNSKGEITYVVNNKSVGSRAEAMNMLSTPVGGTFSVVLSDGSKVWLNAVSSLSFPEVFGDTERRVRVTGEAYFEIAKDNRKPFIVNSGSSEIKVLGTHFNVMAYPDEFRSELTLLEGSIQFSKGAHARLLKPGKQLQYTESSDDVYEKTAIAEEVIAWKNKLFVFNSTSLYEIMKSLTRWYGVQVRFEGEIPDLEFTGEIPRNANVSKVLKALELTGDVSFGIERNVIICRNQKAKNFPVPAGKSPGLKIK